MNWKNLCSQIDQSCVKRYFNRSEYKRIKRESVRVISTDLYREFGAGSTYQEFYAEMKQYFYYDKYICDHGTEFVYYIKFKDAREDTVNFPDLRCIINAIGGFKNVQRNNERDR